VPALFPYVTSYHQPTPPRPLPIPLLPCCCSLIAVPSGPRRASVRRTQSSCTAHAGRPVAGASPWPMHQPAHSAQPWTQPPQGSSPQTHSKPQTQRCWHSSGKVRRRSMHPAHPHPRPHHLPHHPRPHPLPRRRRRHPHPLPPRHPHPLHHPLGRHCCSGTTPAVTAAIRTSSAGAWGECARACIAPLLCIGMRAASAPCSTSKLCHCCPSRAVSARTDAPLTCNSQPSVCIC
jgi:hypothetical protein